MLGDSGGRESRRALRPLYAFASLKLHRTRFALTWAKTVNDARNDVAHRGLFSSTNKAKTIIAAAKSFITTLVPLYEPSFELKDK
jgi:hypothetical protein